MKGKHKNPVIGTKPKRYHKLQIQRPATPTDIVTARMKASLLSDKTVNHLGPLTEEEAQIFANSTPAANNTDSDANTVLSIGNKLAGKNNITKTQFYAYRDAVYDILKKSGKNFSDLPGKPFAKFGHNAIKDSPIKNYAPELAAFKKTVQEYYPDVYAQVENAAIINDRKTNAAMDYNLNQGTVKEILEGVSNDYVENLKRKELAGIPLTDAEKKILQAYNWLDNQLRQGAKERITQDIGTWLVDNWFIVVALLILLYIAVKKS